MGLDIRRPLGLLFVVLGLVLAGYGVVSDRAVYARSLGINVNLWWGLCLCVFGVVCLVLARRGVDTSRLTDASPAGQETERREHVLGLEHER